MSATIRQIVDDAQGIVGEVAGAGVQTFSEDRMFADAIRGFNLLFKEYFWDQYLRWSKLTLDGTLGVVTSTTELATVLDFEDVLSVHRDKEEAPLPTMPRKKNPFARLATGQVVLYWTALEAVDANYATKRLQFYPKTSVGIVNVCARHYPLDTLVASWDWENVMYLDRDMLAYATAFTALAGDDLNPGAADVAKNMMEKKLNTIRGSLATRPKALGSGLDVPNRWRETL